MRTVLIEGVPGTGKTRLAETVCGWLEDRGELVRLLTEKAQDDGVFGDVWQSLDARPERAARKLLRRWRRIYRVRTRDFEAAYIFDNALFNHVQYLMALGMADEGILSFYRAVCAELLPLRSVIVFLEGDAEAIIQRIMAERADRWTPRVVDLVADTPYQRARSRVGGEGLVSFMSDSMSLRRRLIDEGPLPTVRCDVTTADWKAHTDAILRSLAERWSG
jgi:thymidylate kinase